MKWWYVLVLMLGVVLGWWLLQKYGVKSSTRMVTMSEAAIKKEVSNLPTVIMDSNDGKKISAVAIKGVIQSWTPETGLVEFMSGNKLWKVTVDPPNMIVYTPNVMRREQVFKISDKNDVQWASAFCNGDPVDVRFEEGKLVAISNGGYRVCGFRGQ